MAKPIKKHLLRNHIRNSYLTSVISISMVLFLLGILGLIVLNAKTFSEYIKENIGFSLILDENATEPDIISLQKKLDGSDFVKATKYVDKETAAKQLQEELGEDFMTFLGYNPLLASIDVQLYARYAQPDSMVVLQKKIMTYPHVKEISYQKNIVTMLNENIQKISVVLLFFSCLLLIIFVALINNTIRLQIYSQRFILNTMQLVGATRGFIRKPFVKTAVINGAVGALIANILLVGLIYTYQRELNGLMDVSSKSQMGSLIVFVFAAGIVISWVSTVLSVNKYLRLSFDELF
ncbi:MAG: permease-like cell division protein FtsX [Bacteroidota bacterium]|nr:permease-like cell division protein FtsX [Bacteroidota bacterium]MDP4205450.1 permease-like cell division protein FtsX [Bacteroidota bacterium]